MSYVRRKDDRISCIHVEKPKQSVANFPHRYGASYEKDRPEKYAI